MSILVNNIPVSILSDSLEIENILEERSTCSFVINENGNYEEGQNVSVTKNGIILFAGLIEQVQEINLTSTVKVWKVYCKDWHYLLDKRIISKAYKNMRAGDIVTDIINNYLQIEGIVAQNIDSGILVEEAVFNYIPISQALNSLAELTHFWWDITNTKGLRFRESVANPAPWELLDNDIVNDSLTIEKGNTQYRNKQYIKGGKGQTDVLIRNYKGDGTIKTWVVDFPCSTEPVVKVNGVIVLPTDVGIRGLESNKKYYWSKGSNEISQDDLEPTLTPTDILTIEYVGEYDIVAVTFNQLEIDNKSIVENNSGIIEEVSDEPNVNSRKSAFQIAGHKMQKYGVAKVVISFETRKTGLEMGQMLTYKNDQYLIESITINTSQEDYRYHIKMIKGVTSGSWVKFFANTLELAKLPVIRENISESQILTILHQFSKTWTLADRPNIFIEIFPGINTFPGNDTFPSFTEENRVSHMELLDSVNNVIIRKDRTSQTWVTPNLETLNVLQNFEANESIFKIRWYGGIGASLTNGSGVIVDEQSFVITKTDLEAWLLEKTDAKGW